MKKVLFGVLALIFATALVIGGYIFFTGRDLQTYAVEDASCPYYWEELRSGTYRLEINTAKYPGYAWSVESYPKNVVAVSEVSSEPETTVFSILPLNMGQTYVQVSCEQTDPFTARVFEISMQISVSEERVITVEKTEHKEYEGIKTMGEDGAHPIQWWTNSDGAVNLLITGEEERSWEAVDYDANSITVSGPFYRQGSCGYEIRGKKAGNFSLVIYDGSTEAIFLELEVTEDLTAAIAAFSVDAYALDRSEEHMALESAVGRAIVLPPQAAATKYSVDSKRGSVDFLLNDEEWQWVLSIDESAEALVGDIAEFAFEAETATVGAAELTAYKFKDGVVVSWDNGDCAMMLCSGSEVMLADALALAEQIVEANHGE